MSIPDVLSLFAPDSLLWSVVTRSLWVSGWACLFGCVIGVPLGACLGVSRFTGRGMSIAVLNTYLAVPSVVMGLIIYLLLSRSGPLGFLGWLFSVPAMILAQTLLVLPVASALTRQLIEDAENNCGEQLTAMGAQPAMRAMLLALDARWSFITIIVACFSRAIAEVGAVTIVGGNIEGFTRVMTTSIALETSKGDIGLAIALGAVLLAVVMLLHLLLNWLQPNQDRSGLLVKVQS
jgi:tungstate transport system permease protein